MRATLLILLLLCACGRSELVVAPADDEAAPRVPCATGSLLALGHADRVRVLRVCAEGAPVTVAELEGHGFEWSATGRWLMVSGPHGAGVLRFWSPTGAERALPVPFSPKAWDWLADDDAVVVKWNGPASQDLSVLDLRGEEVVVHELAGIARHEALTPDGRHLAYVADEGIRIAELDLSAPGGIVTAEHELSIFGDCAASPDGRWLSVLFGSSVRLVPLGADVPVEAVAAGTLQPCGDVLWALEHPVLATINPSTQYDCEYCGCNDHPPDLEIIDLRGLSSAEAATQALLIAGTAKVPAHALAWATSPAGHPRLAAVAPSAADAPELRILDLADTPSEIGAMALDSRWVHHVAFSPDGESIAYEVDTATHVDLFAATAPHWVPRRLTRGAWAHQRAPSCQWSNDSRHAVCLEVEVAPNYREELWTLSVRESDVHPERIVTAEGAYVWGQGFSRDGRLLAYLLARPGSGSENTLVVQAYGDRGPIGEARTVATVPGTVPEAAWQP